MSGQGRHTILLVQFKHNENTRTYMDFESISACMDGICGLYEEKLKQTHSHSRQITYDINNLWEYISSLADMSCLVYKQEINAYLPYGKDWIKERVFQHLKREAMKGQR
eukprot:Rmarinus@m.5833